MANPRLQGLRVAPKPTFARFTESIKTHVCKAKIINFVKTALI